MFHAFFLFDYERFRQNASPYIELADKGEFTPIIEKANKIAVTINPEDWILEDLGTTLKGFSYLKQKGSQAHIVGFSFLVLLSNTLEMVPFTSFGLGNIADIVASLGWNDEDVGLFRKGMATTVLLKPSLVGNVLERPPIGDPRWYDSSYYWWWLRPENAFHTGWWDAQQLERFHGMLAEIRSNFEQVDIGKLNLHPSVTKIRLLDDYDKTMKLFNLAKERQFGLLLIIK